jgi:hypothetical protein
VLATVTQFAGAKPLTAEYAKKGREERREGQELRRQLILFCLLWLFAVAFLQLLQFELKLSQYRRFRLVSLL